MESLEFEGKFLGTKHSLAIQILKFLDAVMQMDRC